MPVSNLTVAANILSPHIDRRDMPVSNLNSGCQHSESTYRHACASVFRMVQSNSRRLCCSSKYSFLPLPPNQPGRQKAAPVSGIIFQAKIVVLEKEVQLILCVLSKQMVISVQPPLAFAQHSYLPIRAWTLIHPKETVVCCAWCLQLINGGSSSWLWSSHQTAPCLNACHACRLLTLALRLFQGPTVQPAACWSSWSAKTHNTMLSNKRNTHQSVSTTPAAAVAALP